MFLYKGLWDTTELPLKRGKNNKWGCGQRVSPILAEFSRIIRRKGRMSKRWRSLGQEGVNSLFPEFSAIITGENIQIITGENIQIITGKNIQRQRKMSTLVDVNISDMRTRITQEIFSSLKLIFDQMIDWLVDGGEQRFEIGPNFGWSSTDMDAGGWEKVTVILLNIDFSPFFCSGLQSIGKRLLLLLRLVWRKHICICGKLFLLVSFEFWLRLPGGLEIRLILKFSTLIIQEFLKYPYHEKPETRKTWKRSDLEGGGRGIRITSASKSFLTKFSHCHQTLPTKL